MPTPEPIPPVSSPQSAQQLLDRAVSTLLAGGIVAYPTETVWGLAVHPDHPRATARLLEVKGRERDKPLQVSCASAALATTLALPCAALDALAVLWPGPLTLVAPAGPGCPPDLAPGGRVGLRVPDHAVALALLRACGGRLITTSCNRAGQPPVGSAQEAARSGLADSVLPDVDLVQGPQECQAADPSGLASTVVLLPEGVIVRHGSVSETQIRGLLAALTDDRP